MLLFVYSLGEFKDDQLQSHTHSFSGTTSSNGNHSHTFQVNNTLNSPGGYTIAYDSGWKIYDQSTSANVAHTHTFSDTTAKSSGRSGSTTHSKQLGVNYIIKY